MRPVRGVFAVVLVTALAMAGCTEGSVDPTTSPESSSGERILISATPGTAVDRIRLAEVDPQVQGMAEGLTGKGLSGYLAQKLEWTPCGDLECAQVLAPLDYADPSARALTLAMARKRATVKPHLGPLFVNPGGPGASGRSFVGGFDSAGLEQYDIVGWDPRGTGGSTPVACYGPAETEAYFSLDKSPDTEAERTDLIEAVYGFGKACWEHSGLLLEHISTLETARDLDLLRRLLGADRLNYVGYSYGTKIGATYAELFAGNTGRLVLDAAVDITDDDDVIQAMGFDLALGNFARWCLSNDCAFGADESAVIDTVTNLFDQLDAKPLAVGNRALTQALAVSGVAAMLYGQEASWQQLATMISAALSGDGSGLLSVADGLNGRTARGDYSPMAYAFPAISCLDSDSDRGVLSADQTWSKDQARAPVFGKYFGPAYDCALWPVQPARQLDIRGTGAPPILVIGGTGDSATPYQQAVDMARQLESGVLVTRVGPGHGSYGRSGCVDAIVRKYLVKGKAPAEGARCE